MKKCLLAAIVFVSVQGFAGKDQEPLAQIAPTQRFVCNTGYSVQRCREQVAVLWSVLHKYPVQQLQGWTWVLVRSQDWKDIVVPRGLDPDSPAFTYLEKRETFIEEALLSPIEVSRRIELFEKWQLPFDRLLELAVTHELGHAICHERDERKADSYGESLRQGKTTVCQVHR